MENKKIKICLGLLSNRGFRNKTVVSLLRMVNESPEFEWFVLEAINGYTIAENRNWLAAQAVKNNCDYLLMIDDDMVFPPETARVLVSRDKDIIGVVYSVRKKDVEIYVLLADPEIPPSETEPYEVLAMGTGIALIKCEVFKKIPQPWFAFETHDNGMVKMGEDYFFCNKAYANKFKIWLDPTLKIGHLGEHEFLIKKYLT